MFRSMRAFRALILTVPSLGAIIFIPACNQGKTTEAESDNLSSPRFEVASVQDFPPPQPTITPTPLPDVQIPQNFDDKKNPIQFFDDYSWQIFIALNWPAKEGVRGVADLTKKPGDTSLAVVWETWKPAFELFRSDRQSPSEWNSPDTVSPCPDAPDAASKMKTLVSFTAFGNVLTDLLQFDKGTAIGPLVAQNRTYVLYEIRVNQLEYNFIRGDPSDPKTHLYMKDVLMAPRASPIAFPVTSIAVKGAWKELKTGDPLDRYYHVEAMAVNPVTKKCEKKTFGLVGLHIAQKTTSRPQWIWSTFEHEDNLTGGKPSFNDGVTRPGPHDNEPPQTNPSGGFTFVGDPDPVQVTRIVTNSEITRTMSSTQTTNDLYHNDKRIKGTVWAHYVLIRTQWPTVKPPNPRNLGAPFPSKNVANVTMETYVQTDSCMSCHGATQQGSDFVWFLEVRALDPAVQDLKSRFKRP